MLRGLAIEGSDLRMSTPKTVACAEATFFAALRKAGVPEE
jgi:hypothetical protein